MELAFPLSNFYTLMISLHLQKVKLSTKARITSNFRCLLPTGLAFPVAPNFLSLAVQNFMQCIKHCHSGIGFGDKMLDASVLCPGNAAI